MSDAGVHIAAWQSAGLIDGETADRLRGAEPVVAGSGEHHPDRQGPRAPGQAGSSTWFGPAVAIAEVFGYLGIAFLVAAWFATIERSASTAANPEVVRGIGAGIAAIAFVALGLNLRSGDDRRRRAAGVALVMAVAAAGGAAGAFADGAGIEWPLVGVIGSAGALVTAVALRLRHPAVLTQFGLLATLTALWTVLLAWFEETLFPGPNFTESLDPSASIGTGPDPIVLVIASGAWWLASAVVIGLIGLREARSAGPGREIGAARRAGISRLWAGFVAITGLTMAVTRTDFLAGDEYGRVLEPWIGDVLLLVVSAILIERAFRREAAAFIYPAALGLILALSDFNFSYLSDNTESGLLVEGVILLLAGLAADRLRRRVGRLDPRDEPDPTAKGAAPHIMPGDPQPVVPIDPTLGAG